MSISCLRYVAHNILDTCNCICANAQSVRVSGINSRDDCEHSCTSRSWCVMYSYVPDCVLYSYDKPCETCDTVDSCSSNCTGCETYLKRECDARRLSLAVDPPLPPLPSYPPPVRVIEVSPPPPPPPSANHQFRESHRALSHMSNPVNIGGGNCRKTTTEFTSYHCIDDTSITDYFSNPSSSGNLNTILAACYSLCGGSGSKFVTVYYDNGWINWCSCCDYNLNNLQGAVAAYATYWVEPCHSPPLPPSPSPPPSHPPPMAGTLDFARYDPHNPGEIEMSPDGLLTTEFTLIEHYARLGAEGRHNDDYWCDALTRPALQCLDIGAPSTLGGSLNVSRATTNGSRLDNNMLIYHIQETANTTSDDLFGQYDRCHSRLVGDGVIDVFDMATLLSYIFGDWKYRDLAPDPHAVVTTQGRRVTASLCGQGFTRQDYAEQYALDTCVHTDGAVETGGRRLAETRLPTVSSSRRVVGVYLRSCGTYEQCVIVDRPVFLIFISILDSSYGANVSGVHDATVHRHVAGVVLSRGQYGGGTLAPIDGGVRRIVVPPHARLGRVEAYASATEELSVIARPSFPVRWSDYVASPSPSSMSSSVSLRNGHWSTFDMTMPVSRLHAVFAQRFNAHLSMQPFVASDRPGWNEVRVTRHCAPEWCIFCASIETGLNAVHHGTLEMFQTPIHSSCAYSVHVYASGTVTLQYAIATTSRDFHPPAWSRITCIVQRSTEESPPLPVAPHSLPPSIPPPPPKTPLHFPPSSVKTRMFIWISLGLILWSAVLCVFVARMQTRPPPHPPITGGGEGGCELMGIQHIAGRAETVNLW